MIWIARDTAGRPAECCLGRTLDPRTVRDWTAHAYTWQEEPASAWTDAPAPDPPLTLELP